MMRLEVLPMIAFLRPARRERRTPVRESGLLLAAAVLLVGAAIALPLPAAGAADEGIRHRVDQLIETGTARVDGGDIAASRIVAEVFIQRGFRASRLADEVQAARNRRTSTTPPSAPR